MKILTGKKKREYREVKPFWSNRLEKPEGYYDRVQFILGYSKNAPRMIVEHKGLDLEEVLYKITNEIKVCYAIELGNILKTEYCENILE